MILTSVCVLLLVSPPAAPRCAPDDFACTAEAAVREADSTEDRRVRAEALLTAVRAYFLLYKKTGHRTHICTAERLLGRLPRAQPPDVGEYMRKMRAEISSELARLGFDCKSDRPVPKKPAVARRPNLSQKSPAPSPTAPAAADAREPDEDRVLLNIDMHKADPAPTAVAPAPAPASEPVALTDASSADRMPNENRLLLETGAHKFGPTPRVPASAIPEAGTWAPSSAPGQRSPDRPPGTRPGRGLLIGGGVALTSACAFGALALGAMIQRDHLATQHDALASNANHDGFTTPDDDLARGQLAPEVTRWHRLMVGASISSGVLAGAAVALISTGAAKRWHSWRLAVRPAPGGILLNARF